MGKCYVYRYMDTNDNIIKYIGIVYKSNLRTRIMAHKSKDAWKDKGNWKVEYFECENKSEAEAFESHLISLHETYKYYNKAKGKWGINRFLPDVSTWWKPMKEKNYKTFICEDKDVQLVVNVMKIFIKHKRYNEVKTLLELLKVEFDEV